MVKLKTLLKHLHQCPSVPPTPNNPKALPSQNQQINMQGEMGEMKYCCSVSLSLTKEKRKNKKRGRHIDLISLAKVT